MDTPASRPDEPNARAAPRSVYAETARPGVSAPALASALRIETVVVGGGYTGLSTALHLAERGREVALLEAEEPGFGAAGRNGGQVNAGLKHDPEVVEAMLGPSHGPQLVRRALGAPEFLFQLIARLGIECEARRCGTLRAATSPRRMPAIRATVRQCVARGLPVEAWDEEQMHAATGTSRYSGGVFDRSGGALNPLSLARGLAMAAARAGAQFYHHSKVTSLERAGSQWRANTDRGHVVADHVVLATDGYTDHLWPHLRRSVVPLHSAILATAPLCADLQRAVLPGGQVVYETGHITTYYRRDAADRLLMGGRGVQRAANDRGAYDHLVRAALRLWPDLEATRWTHWWNGPFALTPNFLPHFHVPERGLYILLGFSGRGVALSTSLGAALAAVLAGDPLESFPIPSTQIVPIRGHRFWRLGVRARVWQGQLLDRLGL